MHHASRGVWAFKKGSNSSAEIPAAIEITTKNPLQCQVSSTFASGQPASVKASPTPMSFSEVYIGLQQGTIDAQENPYEVIVSNKLYEQQDYVVETNHLPHLISLIVSDEFFQDLPEDKQAILVEAAEIAKEEARQASDDRIADKIKVIEDSGTQIVTLSDELRAEIREAVQPVYDEIEKNVDKKLYNAYMK